MSLQPGLILSLILLSLINSQRRKTYDDYKNNFEEILDLLQISCSEHEISAVHCKNLKKKYIFVRYGNLKELYFCPFQELTKNYISVGCKNLKIENYKDYTKISQDIWTIFREI